MKRYYIKIENINVGITEWGYKGNPPIICIHGLGGSSLSFIEIGEMLKDRYHFISVDLPGHGRTNTFQYNGGFELPNLAEWIDKVVTALGYDNFHILAHSWGGDIALHYTAAYPYKVNKVLLLDGGYYFKDKFYKYMGNTLEDDIIWYEKDFDGYVFPNADDFYKEEEKAYLRYSDLLRKASMDLMKQENNKLKFIASGAVAKAALIGMYNSPTSLIFDKLSDNILLLQSTLPKSYVRVREYLCDFFTQNSKVIVKKIEASSHMLHWDKPDIVINEIIAWFN